MRPMNVVLLSLLLVKTVYADYSKVAINGSSLPASSKTGANSDDWGCTYDSKTQLMWEVKSNDGSLRDKRWHYSWFDQNPNNNGGSVGTSNGGICFDSNNCDTQKFSQQVNKLGLCGGNNWRLPTLEELKTLFNPAYNVAINPYFFPDLNVPNTKVYGYWSAITASNPNQASFALFEKAKATNDPKSALHRVRLVREAKNFVAAASPEVLVEDFNNQIKAGIPHGISFQKTLTGRGAKFSHENESRIQYPFATGFLKAGTLEFLLNINNGYRYDNFQLKTNFPCALVFSSYATTPSNDAPVGSAWLYACQNGDITFAIKSANHPVIQTVSAKATSFRFNKWFLLSVSYGQKGQAIAVNGDVVAAEPQNTQALGSGDTSQIQSTLPTIGESVAIGAPNNQSDAGFDGVIDTIRASKASKDWILGSDRPKLKAKLAAGSFRKPNQLPEQAIGILVNDYFQRHLFGRANDNWFQFFAKPGLRYTLEIPNDSVGDSLNPGLELYDKQNHRIAGLINANGIGEGESLQWTAPSAGLYRLKISNQAPLAKAAMLDSAYDLQIFLTDQPQQGIVKGLVHNNCNRIGLAEAEVSSYLNDLVTDSTLTFTTGEFGLPLNPDDYQIKSIATNFNEASQVISVTTEDIAQVNLGLVPTAECASFSPTATDLALLEQQALAVYDSDAGSLIIKDIQIDNAIYYVELADQGNLQFKLTRSIEIPNRLHNPVATYSSAQLTAELPSVFALDKTYKVTLQQQSNGLFGVAKVE